MFAPDEHIEKFKCYVKNSMQLNKHVKVNQNGIRLSFTNNLRFLVEL